MYYASEFILAETALTHKLTETCPPLIETPADVAALASEKTVLLKGSFKPADVRTNRAQLDLQSLVATIQMMDMSDHRLAFGDEARQD